MLSSLVRVPWSGRAARAFHKVTNEVRSFVSASSASLSFSSFFLFLLEEEEVIFSGAKLLWFPAGTPIPRGKCSRTDDYFSPPRCQGHPYSRNWKVLPSFHPFGLLVRYSRT